ncbi:MAG: hypothetical protein HQL75_02960 [Magnetococcales bacterium]|nr:hypothetical protein [Magnetococcales bacterium]
MSEANSVSPMLTYSLKNLFRPGHGIQPQSRQEVSESGRFENTLADMKTESADQQTARTAHKGIDSVDALSMEPSMAHQEPVPFPEESLGGYPSSMQGMESLSPSHSPLTWQLVSSTTDVERNEDLVQTAALPLKGYRIYSEAASRKD